MKTESESSTPRAQARLHPLVAAAAAAVIVLSITGVAAITGYLPGTSAQKGDPQATPLAPQGNAARIQANKPKTVAAARPTSCTTCGTVADVRQVTVNGEGTGLGAVAGGVAGGLLGNQIGDGRGRTVMTVAGAAGGAFAGNEIEKRARSQTHYVVDVRMEDGTLKQVSYQSAPSWRSGDRVRLTNGTLEALR